MLTRSDIEDFCNSFNYDLRVSNNGRWIDQKCTPDVVSIIADCIYNYYLDNPNTVFSTFDIWHNKYTINNVESIFRKPSVVSSAAKNEYDKFFQQPMELLANAKVLLKCKVKNRNLYSVNNLDILEYIALRERNALYFLTTYIEKVLRDSSLFGIFDNFFSTQTNTSYNELKSYFSDFVIANTRINGKTECNRIFIKVLNPLAFSRNKRGTERGRISSRPISYDMLMYNRNNFRDLYSDKPRGITRKEYLEACSIVINEDLCGYQARKAKKFLKLFNDEYRNGKSEHYEVGHMEDRATHVHHIFPQSSYPEISSYLENLIALTPTQHLNYAHPNGRTQEIDNLYQHLLLLSKSERIHENLVDSSQETIYDFSKFIYVLKAGFDDDNLLCINDMDFVSIVVAINRHYANNYFI